MNKLPQDDSTELDPESVEKDKKDSLKISRRCFLGTMAAVSGAAMISSPSISSSASKEFSNLPDRYGLLTDLTACVGCRSCEEACNKANNLPQPAEPFDDKSVFNKKRRPNAKAYTVVNQYTNPKEKDKPVYRKIQCNHCNEPACATSCPVHAYTKTREGAVLYNEDLCFGCRYCMTACPFYAPSYDYWSAFKPKIVKCTMCYNRIKAGGITACAEACPAGALTFGKRNDLIKFARERIAKYQDKYIDHIYGENEVGGTSWMYISGVPFEQLGFANNLPKKPLLDETKGFLSAVPVVLTVWPALFGMAYAALRHRDQSEEDKTSAEKEERK